MISLEDGGNPTDPKNLFPEAYNTERFFESGSSGSGYFLKNLQWTDANTKEHGLTMIPPSYQDLPSKPIDINSAEGKALKRTTIEAGRLGLEIKEVYKGWEDDYAKGMRQRKKSKN